MPRFYFHYRTDDELIRDTDGSELPDLEAAEHNAAALAKAIVEQAASKGGDTRIPRSIETGTHVLFAGAVIEAETTSSRSPLLWQRHDYHGLAGLD